MSLLITHAGIAAAIRAGDLGIEYKITHISIGSAGYVPKPEQTALVAEIQKKAITRGALVAQGQLHFETVWDGDEEFEGKELGYWLEDGTLFAVDSRDGEVITFKRKDTVVTEACELNLAASTIENITVELLGTPYATETVAGIAKIATSALVSEGFDDETIVTPKKLKEKIVDHKTEEDPHSQYMIHGDYGLGGSEFVPIAYGKLLSDINKTEYRLVSGGAIPSDSPEPTAALVFTKWANASNATQVWERLTSDQVPVLYRRVYRNGVWGGWVKDPTQASIQATYEKIANLKAAAYKNVGLDAGNVMPVGAFGLGVTNQISLEDDLDSILTNGFYYVPPNHPQSPTAGAGYVIVPHTTSSSNTVQLSFDAANDEVYFRRITTETIFEWKKLWSSGNTPANLAGSGYLKLPNGLIFQWGTVTGIGAPGSKTVTLPIAFTTAAYSATCAHKGVSGGNATVSSLSLTQITLFNESTSGGSTICYWIVGK